MLASLPLVVLAGLVGRFALPGFLGDLVGGITYAALIYVLVAAAWPQLARAHVGMLAWLASCAVELFQLTGIPNDLADAFSPSRLVLGTSFAATDLLAYAIGAGVAAAVDRTWSVRVDAAHAPGFRDPPESTP